MAEQWHDISGYNGVSDLGQVRNTQTSKILQPVRFKNGRLYVTLSYDGFSRKCTVHSLVAASFVGTCPPGHEVAHKDDDYTNNAVTNLEYVTRRENNGVTVVPENGNGHRSLAAAVADFIEETRLTKKPKTLVAYTTALQLFH